MVYDISSTSRVYVNSRNNFLPIPSKDSEAEVLFWYCWPLANCSLHTVSLQACILDTAELRRIKWCMVCKTTLFFLLVTVGIKQNKIPFTKLQGAIKDKVLYGSTNHLIFGRFSQNCEKRLLASCLYVLPHGTIQLPLGVFSWNFVYFFRITCRENSWFIKIWQQLRVL